MKNNRFKKTAAILIACITALGLAACGGSKAEQAVPAAPSNAPAAQIYWLNFKPEFDASAQALAEKYTELTGIPVRVATPASGTYQEALASEMEMSDAPTIFVIGNREGVQKWGNYATDLRGTAIEAELNTDAYNYYDADGSLVSIGYCYECYGIIVNPDLLERAGHNVNEIKNFESLKTVAEDIHKRADTLGFDAFTSSDLDPSSSWRFTAHMANLEYVYEERETGSVWTECPETITGNYLDNYRMLFDLCINNSLTGPAELAAGGHDAENEFKTGKAAFYVNGSWEYASLSETVPNAVMIPYYCGVEGEEKAGLNCGTENCWAVNRYASEQDQRAAIDFMVWLVSDPEASAEMVRELGVIPYKNAPASDNAFLNDAEKYTADGCYVFDWATNFQPNTEVYRAGIVTALDNYCAKQSDAAWALVEKAFVDGWAEQYDAMHKK